MQCEARSWDCPALRAGKVLLRQLQYRQASRLLLPRNEIAMLESEVRELDACAFCNGLCFEFAWEATPPGRPESVVIAWSEDPMGLPLAGNGRPPDDKPVRGLSPGVADGQRARALGTPLEYFRSDRRLRQGVRSGFFGHERIEDPRPASRVAVSLSARSLRVD